VAEGVIVKLRDFNKILEENEEALSKLKGQGLKTGVTSEIEFSVNCSSKTAALAARASLIKKFPFDDGYQVYVFNDTSQIEARCELHGRFEINAKAISIAELQLLQASDLSGAEVSWEIEA